MFSKSHKTSDTRVTHSVAVFIVKGEILALAKIVGPDKGMAIKYYVILALTRFSSASLFCDKCMNPICRIFKKIH